uniref:Uncharacterized protein n=1 Tax=mine drainage metagenome TaxID=410659 RepID=E6PNE2_9ZZZZ
MRQYLALEGLARVKTRAWIETPPGGFFIDESKVSLGLKPGRGLKLTERADGLRQDASRSG